MSVDVFINERRIYVNEDGIMPVCELIYSILFTVPNAYRYN